MGPLVYKAKQLEFHYLRGRAASLPTLELQARTTTQAEGIMPRMMTAARATRFRYKKRETTADKKHKQRPRTNSTISLSNSVTASHDSLCSSVSSSQASLSGGNSLTVPDHPNMRRRSGSVPALKIVTLASTWNLKHEHVRALKMTWGRLCEPPRSNCKGIVALVERVWERLNSKDKMIKEIFYKAAFVDSMTDRCERRCSNGRSIATLRDHTHFFVSLVSQTISQLDHDPQQIFDHIDKIGRRHAYLKQYGFKSQHWEKIGEYFIDIVVIQDCVRGFPEACRAWTIFIAAIIDRLRAAPRRGSLVTPISTTPATSTTSIPSSSSPMCSQFRIYGSGIIRTSSQELREKRGSERIQQGTKARENDKQSSEHEMRSSRMGPRHSIAVPTCISLSSLEKALPETSDMRSRYSSPECDRERKTTVVYNEFPNERKNTLVHDENTNQLRGEKGDILRKRDSKSDLQKEKNGIQKDLQGIGSGAPPPVIV